MRLRLVLGGAALAALSAACVSNASQDSLDAAGPYTEKINSLFAPVFWIAVAVFVVVEGLLVLFLIRYRHRRGREDIPPQVHGNTRLEIGWTILPALVLAGIAVPTVAGLWDLAQECPSGSMRVTVIGHQFWWEFRYTDPGMAVADNLPLTTANELHIPVDAPVCLSLQADPKDVSGAGFAVIHSFWTPRLHGTQDVVPGRVNQVIVQADDPGVYSGQCKEFCGLSHANMRHRIIAHTQEEFDTWTAGQKEEAAVPTDSLAQEGAKLFVTPVSSGAGTCIQCHSINGLEGAQGLGGPNLTHFADRDCFLGCMSEVNEENLRRWLSDPPAMKPGSKMPNYRLTDEELDALVAYLLTLE